MQTDELVRYKTGISQVYWCDTSDKIAEFQPARLAFDSPERQHLSWFDMLFEGGILLPRDEANQPPRPLTMLVSGPPGCGKTTLITELCYRLAVNAENNANPLSTLYISTDAETGRMVHNAIDLGWDKARDYFIPFDPAEEGPRIKRRLRSLIAVWGREKFLASVERQDLLHGMIETAITSLNHWLLKADPPAGLKRKLLRGIVKDPVAEATGGDGSGEEGQYIPDILVIDSLNILDPHGQAEFFQAFVKVCKATKLVIFMLNTGSENEGHKLWEYFSDIVVRLDSEYAHDYYVRTIEVVKARFQSHRWGKHQLKIYANPQDRTRPSEDDPKAIQQYNTAMRRAHPYRPTGGVFIFPSIHSYLSVYKRQTASEIPARDDTYPAKLNDVLQIPKGRCTAFVGGRGGHKSHLGYLHLLHRLLQHDRESGLIVSLREDEGTTKETLARIAETEFNCRREHFEQLESDNHLEILYFPPGYITPEEFFHRVFISVHRLKKQNSSITVLFNSLDQISARFPLCAKQEIFIPGLIQTLSGEGATSICIAVNERGQPWQQYGLLPMADLIVSFSLRQFPARAYYNHLCRGWQNEFDKDTALLRKFEALQERSNLDSTLKHEAIVLQVIRFSGGERAGKRGMLELVKQNELDRFPYAKAGLHFTPLSEELMLEEPLPQQEADSGASAAPVMPLE